MIKLALRNILRHKGRFAITLAAVVFGVVALVFSGGFVADVFVQLREVTIHSQLGHIQIQKAGFTELGRRAPYDYLLQESDTLAEKLSSFPHVVNVMQRLEFSGLLTKGRADIPIIGQGVEPEKEAALGTFFRIIDGRRLRDDDQFGMLVGQGIANAFKLKVGDTVFVMVNTPEGSLNSLEFTLVGVFQTFSKDFDDRAIQIPLPAARELLDTAQSHVLVMHLDDTKFTDQLAAELRPRLPNAHFDVLRWVDLADFYRSTVALYERQFGVLQLIVLLMVVLGVGNSINMAIFERTGEFGTQRAVGDRAHKIFKLIVLEAGIIGIVGSLAGVLLGCLLAWGVSKVGIPMPPPPNSNAGYTAYVRIVPDVLVSAMLVGVFASVFASLLPAWRTTRIPIVDALRQNI